MTKDEQILKAQKQLQRKVDKLQRELYDLLMDDFVGEFATKDGKLVFSDGNVAKINKVDSLVDEISSVLLALWIGSQLSLMIDTSFNDFKTRFGADKVNPFEKDLKPLYKRIGIKDGKIMRGSYLDTLNKQSAVKMDIKNYVLNSLAEGREYKDYTKGLKEMLVGENASLQKYYRTYVNDVFAEVMRTADVLIAEKLGLEHFIYSGGLIEESRQFCIKKDGKLFTIAETELWRDDPDLPGKSSKEEYNPLIDMGRWSCRHHAEFITKEEYNERAGNKIDT